MGCPKCGAAVSDTDLVCRNCGMSFVPDAHQVVQGMAYDQTSVQMQQQRQQQQFGASQAPYNPASYNPGAPFNAPNANYPQNPGAPYNAPMGASGMPYGYPGGVTNQLSSGDATSAIIFAIIGFFCAGFIFGPLAIMKANSAKASIALNPGMQGLGLAQTAFSLGWFHVLVWVLYLFVHFGVR